MPKKEKTQRKTTSQSISLELFLISIEHGKKTKKEIKTKKNSSRRGRGG